ncbi:hypothetical protein DA717_10805 [Piscirickettsiaceae bacterium NZ-RLO2]|uniref:hypothetical protein n=1 Tax=Piscirickettsia salmonis TaxID=1238 RepID=UPI000F0807FA|nr:hypothetical protein DA717_10805 [Piscirickettsiaceae bacterium NZ-RLO2]
MALQELHLKIKTFLESIKKHEKDKPVSLNKMGTDINKAVDEGFNFFDKTVGSFVNEAKKIVGKMVKGGAKQGSQSAGFDPSPDLRENPYIGLNPTENRIRVITTLLGKVDTLQSGRDCFNLLLNELQHMSAFLGPAGQGGPGGYFDKESHKHFKKELVECLDACKVQMLEDIRQAITHKAMAGGFEFGLGGSNYTLEMGNQSFGIPKRAYKICKIIDNSDLSAEEKFTKIKEIKVAALTYQPSFPWFRRLTGIGDTKESTNNFLAGLDCAEGCYNEPALG